MLNAGIETKLKAENMSVSLAVTSAIRTVKMWFLNFENIDGKKENIDRIEDK